MIGAIAGDIIGSVYEHRQIKHTDFVLFQNHSAFTDDTVLTVATAQAILEDGDYGRWYRQFGRALPDAGYGGFFMRWLLSENPRPYNSFGNGSAMRVSPVGFAFDSLERVLAEAKKNAEVTHNHPEGIKGAQATAMAVFLARTGRDKQMIKEQISRRFGYDLNSTVRQIRPGYRFDPTCQGSVPEAIIAFLDSDGFEDALRKAVSLGGDSDTLACITGGIAQAYYRHISEEIVAEVRTRLPNDLLEILDRFAATYHC